MLGVKLKELREAKGLLQREVAAQLNVDTAYISKVEHDDKRLSKNHIRILANILGVTDKELLSLWLADKVLSVIEEEDVADQAIDIVQKQIKSKKDEC